MPQTAQEAAPGSIAEGVRGTRQPRLPGLLSKRDGGALVLGILRQFGIGLVHAVEQGVSVTVCGQHGVA